MATIEKRVSQEGEVSYRVKVRLKGFPTQTATFERLTDARNWVQNTEAAIREGRHFKNTKSKNKLFAEFIEKYEKEVLASKQKNTANQKLYLKWWKEQLGDYTLADVTPSLIAETRANLVGTVNKFGKKIGTTTANRYTTALGHVYTIALKEWEWVNDNPVRRLSKFKEARGRVRFLSDEERKAILEACKKSENPYLHDIVVLALSTGARKNELVTLKWNQIDLDRGLIILNETKNDERRSLPLRGYALQLLKAIYDKRDKKCEYAFPSEKVCQPIDIRTAWVNACANAKVEDFRFHDLRHSSASYLAMNGASLAEIAEVLGHKTLQMVKRYAHLSEQHTASVVEKMNNKIFGQTEDVSAKAEVTLSRK